MRGREQAEDPAVDVAREREGVVSRVVEPSDERVRSDWERARRPRRADESSCIRTAKGVAVVPRRADEGGRACLVEREKTDEVGSGRDGELLRKSGTSAKVQRTFIGRAEDEQAF